MNEEQRNEWRAMRAEQDALRTRLELLDQRLTQFERAGAPIPADVLATAPLPAEVVPSLPVLPPVPAVAPAPRESMEMRIGTDWLVRAGVVLLLTSLAFLGDYLYRNIVPRLGPWPKVGLLYLGAGTLAGLGAWLERTRRGRELPKVRNYARVLLAGGLAAVYYVTYAAHYYPNLRVIGNPLLAGLLLMGWTAFMVWVADRRGSETVATFAILLAYYTSAVNEIAGFTVVSNLPLTAAAVFLLRRHLWKIFPFASLLATFGSYGYWRYFHVYAALRGLPGGMLSDPLPGDGGFWIETAFLLLYWLLFTWAVFSTSEETLPAARRAGFVSLNNGAFFLLVTWSVLEDYPGAFWKWSLGFGIVLLGLAEAWRRLPQRLDAPTENAYRLLGVLLATLGFITYFTGWQLCVVLAAESAVLLAAAGRRSGPLLVVTSMVVALGAFGLTVQQIDESGAGHFKILALAVAVVMVLNGWLVDRSARRASWMIAGFYEGLALALSVLWGEKYFPYEENFSFFVLAGALVFIGGIEARQPRWVIWSYALTAAGLGMFWVSYGSVEHHQPIQWLGIACLVIQQRFGRWCLQDGLLAATFANRVQAFLMTAAVLSAWVTWSTVVEYWHGVGFTLAASWSLYAVVVFAAGLALRERVCRWLAMCVLTGTFGHIAVIDIWQLDSLERFWSLLCLGIVLLAIGFFYTRYQSSLRDIF